MDKIWDPQKAEVETYHWVIQLISVFSWSADTLTSWNTPEWKSSLWESLTKVWWESAFSWFVITWSAEMLTSWVKKLIMRNYQLEQKFDGRLHSVGRRLSATFSPSAWVSLGFCPENHDSNSVGKISIFPHKFDHIWKLSAKQKLFLRNCFLF